MDVRPTQAALHSLGPAWNELRSTSLEIVESGEAPDPHTYPVGSEFDAAQLPSDMPPAIAAHPTVTVQELAAAAAARAEQPAGTYEDIEETLSPWFIRQTYNATNPADAQTAAHQPQSLLDSTPTTAVLDTAPSAPVVASDVTEGLAAVAGLEEALRHPDAALWQACLDKQPMPAPVAEQPDEPAVTSATTELVPQEPATNPLIPVTIVEQPSRRGRSAIEDDTTSQISVAPVEAMISSSSTTGFQGGYAAEAPLPKIGIANVPWAKAKANALRLLPNWEKAKGIRAASARGERPSMPDVCTPTPERTSFDGFGGTAEARTQGDRRNNILARLVALRAGLSLGHMTYRQSNEGTAAESESAPHDNELIAA